MTIRPARRTYRNPPLLEAVVEFQFVPPSGGWNPVFLGKVHSQIEEEFPRVEAVTGTRVEFGQEAGLVAVRPAPEASRFLQEDGGVVATVGPDVLGLSVLPSKRAGGHPGWDWLRDRALDLLQTYQVVVRPQQVLRIGVRYINAIPIIPGQFRLGQLVTAESGLVPAALLGEQNPFSYSVERVLTADQRGRHVEGIQLSAQAVGRDAARLMLDVDQVWIPEPAEEPGSPRAVMEELHAAVHRVFTTVVRPEVLESFDPVDLKEG